MGILKRFSDIMRSEINALLDKAEDPAKLVDQYLLDLRKDLAEVRSETATVMAAEDDAKLALERCKADIERHAKAAMGAVKAGNDDDARQLLAQKQKYEANLPALQEAYDAAHQNAEMMQQMHTKLVNDIQSLEARKDAIKAKAAAAKAQEHINEIVAGAPNAEAGMEAFERLEAKTDKRLSAARAEAKLNAGTGVENLVDKYSGGSSASVEDELAALKAQLGQ